MIIGKLSVRGLVRQAAVLAVLVLSGRAVRAGETALDRARKMVEAARREYLTDAACPFSTAGVVMRTGADPAKLAGFVRGKIGYEPYAGSVRGVAGTLAARAGSDWDRALLLRALLAESGFASELVVIPRKESERQEVVDGFLAGQGRERTLGAGRRPDLSKVPPASPLLAQYGIRLNNRELNLAGAAVRWQGMLDEAYDSGWTQAEQLRPILAKAAKPQPFAAWKAGLAAGAAERVLLYLPATRAFLDVSPDAATVSDTAAKRAKRLTEVPSDRIATVDLRVVLRAADAEKKVKPATILAHSTPLASLFGRNVQVQIVPEASKAPGKPMTEWTPADCHDFVVGCDRFQAVLESGELWQGSLVFDLAGKLFTVSSDGRIEAAKGLGSGVGKLFGGFGGDGGEEEGARTTLESVELEVDLKLPGAEPVKVRRLLCGRLRPGVSPIVHTDMAFFPGPVGPDAVQWLALDAGVRNFRVVADVMSGKDLDAHMRGADVRVMQRMLHEWQLARLGLADRLLSAADGLAYAGGPALVMKTAMLIPRAEPKSLLRRTVIDVAHDGARLVPRTDAAARAAFEANVLLGAASTAFEAQLVREKQPCADLRGACGEFQQAAVQGVQPAVAAAAALGQVKPTELARWGIAANQRAEVLVFPGADAPRSWWSVDGATGVTLGRGDSGEGMSASEYLQLIKMNLSNLKCMVAFMGDFIRGTKRDDALKSWLMCVTGADNPGTYVGAYGGVAGLSMEGGSGFSTAGDIIGGAWDVAGMAGSSGK
jgi:hypothetical protein